MMSSAESDVPPGLLIASAVSPPIRTVGVIDVTLVLQNIKCIMNTV